MERPTKAELGRIAELQPERLNVLVAYFVMEWRSAMSGPLQHGVDQTGTACRLPNYVRAWGVDACVHYLLRSPEVRGASDAGYLSEWLHEHSPLP